MIIEHLQLNGGEVFTRPQLLTKIIDTIIRKRVILGCASEPEMVQKYQRYIRQIVANSQRQIRRG